MKHFIVIAICFVTAGAPHALANVSDAAQGADSQLIQTIDQPRKHGSEKPAILVKVRTVRTGIDDNSLIEDNGNMGNQLVCRIHKVAGSRIKRNRCMTTAEWKKEKETRMLRANLIRGAGRPPAWRTP